MKYTAILIVIASLTWTSCKDDQGDVFPTTSNNADTYFPPLSGTWETTTPESLGWDADKIKSLYDDLEQNGTRAFLVLKNGKIVLENYWGKILLGNTDFTSTSNWYWASAGKTLPSFMVGKAEEDGYLSLSDKSSKYLGEGWTSASKEQENKITVWHQLSMTSGLDDALQNGSSSYMMPQSQLQLPGPIIANAPSDAYVGLGKNGQYLCILPSQSLVIIRMGENPDAALVPLLYLDDIWKSLNEIM